MVRLRRRSIPSVAPVPPPAVESRPEFHRDLQALEALTRAMADSACRSLEVSLRALAASDAAPAGSVNAGDDEIDRRYEEIERRVVDLMGRQQPVASDLRLLIGLLQVSLHLERIGDMAVNVCEATRSAASLPVIPEILHRLQEMGGTAASMTDRAVDALPTRRCTPSWRPTSPVDATRLVGRQRHPVNGPHPRTITYGRAARKGRGASTIKDACEAPRFGCWPRQTAPLAAGY